MDRIELEKKALKQASEAFRMACGIKEDERIEVYYEKESVKTSPVMDEKECLIYDDGRILLYQIYGNSYLEDEIAAWIDQARSEETPQGVAQSVCEMAADIAKAGGRELDSISANEVFANLPLSVIEQIEDNILEYWWENEEEEDGKRLALEQISEGLAKIA